ARLRRPAGRGRPARPDVPGLRAAVEPVFEGLPQLGTIARLSVGAWRISAGAISTGELVQAMALFHILAFPMRVVGCLLEELPRAVVSADRIEGALAAPSRPAPPADAQ